MEKEIYKRCFDFALDIIKFSKKINQDAVYKIITNQLIRSVTSISANIAEGSASVSRKEFINYIGIARKSAVETVHWLRLIFELYKDKRIKGFIDESQQIVNILSKILINTKKR
jgi:four helix bundle protein